MGVKTRKSGVQVKGNKAPNVFVSIPANASSETVKLPVLPNAGSLQSFETQKMYLILNENADFTVNANMQEVELTLNGTNYEATIAVNPNELANYTFYYTIVTRVNPCREGCLKSNKNARSILIKN